MVIFTLMLVDVETESENLNFLESRETPYVIPIYKVLPYLVIIMLCYGYAMSCELFSSQSYGCMEW